MTEPLKYSPVEAPGTKARRSKDDYFDQGHLKKDMNRRVAKSGVITLATQLLKFFLRLGSMAVLARLLVPADFGLISSVTVVTGFIEMFKDSGLSMATVQRDKITHAQISTLFWINIALSGVIMLVEVALAPLLALVYHEPRLVYITVALAGLSIFGGFSIQHQALLQRSMQFGRIAFVEVASMALGIGVGVFMAFRGHGYWALVGMTAATAISTSVFMFAMSGWVPGLPQKKAGVRSMLKFGRNLAGASFFNYLTRNADNFIIGLVLGPASLGVYNRAYSLFLMPMQQFLTPISRVVVPALSRLGDDPVKFRAMVLEKSYFVVFFVTMITGLSFAMAPELILVMLGPAWSNAVPIVRCLSIGGAIYGTNIAGSWVNTTSGRTGRQLRVAIIAGPTYTLAFVAGVYINGAVGVACAFSITCLLLRYPVFKYLLKGSSISPQDLMKPLLTVGIPVAIAAASAMAVASQISGRHLVLVLTVKLLVFSIVLAAFWLCRLLKLPKVSRVE